MQDVPHRPAVCTARSGVATIDGTTTVDKRLLTDRPPDEIDRWREVARNTGRLAKLDRHRVYAGVYANRAATSWVRGVCFAYRADRTGSVFRIDSCGRVAPIRKDRCMPLFFFTVEQQERAILERFGKFVRVAGPGLQRKSPFVEKVAGRMSLQVEQLNADIETKTKDNVFVVVKLAIQYMVGAEEAKVKDAFYKLDDPEVQMKSYAFDVVRSHIPTMDLDEAYADADTIAKHIQDTLQKQMADYGYEIIKALITNIEPDQRVKDAMNNINAARRNQEAATAQGEGDKTLRIKKAEAESESMRLHGEGVAAERKAIAQGLKDSLALIVDQNGFDAKEAMGLVALTQYMDTIRSVGEHGNMTTLLLPHSPASVGSLMEQVREGMLTGNLAADAASGGGNGGAATRAPSPGAGQS
jgi:regulator of protease activity HflC (stomatin/prohibitin superfamily)